MRALSHPMIDPKTLDAILADIASGEPTRRAIVAHGADTKGFYRLITGDEDAGKRYARAKELGLDALADETLALADDSRVGVKTITKANGDVETVTGDMIERSRLQVDTRKWLLAKLAPKKYGERQTLEHEVSDNFAEVLVKARARSKGGDGAT